MYIVEGMAGEMKVSGRLSFFLEGNLMVARGKLCAPEYPTIGTLSHRELKLLSGDPRMPKMFFFDLREIVDGKDHIAGLYMGKFRSLERVHFPIDSALEQLAALDAEGGVSCHVKLRPLGILE